MAGSFEASQTAGNIVVTFQYDVDQAKAQVTVNKAVLWLIERDRLEVVFEDLTWQEKLNIIDAWIRSSIVKVAKSQIIAEEDVNRDAAVAIAVEELM